MCYVYNQWYDISCGTLYIHKFYCQKICTCLYIMDTTPTCFDYFLQSSSRKTDDDVKFNSYVRNFMLIAPYIVIQLCSKN